MHHDLWDLDASAAPQLTTIRHNGRNRDVVVATNKTGWLYVLDRVTGEPIWPIEERPVPKSEMPGEESWPTQPHPTKPEPYVRHTFTVDDINPDLPADEKAAFTKRLLEAVNKGIFTPISLKDTVHVPTSNGGTLMGGVGRRTPYRRHLPGRARESGHSPAAETGRRPRRRAAADAAGPGGLSAELSGVPRCQPRGRGRERPGARSG